MPPIITLLSDFGSADSYVGEVKGVLLSHVHGAALLGITHQVPPGAPRAAQYILGRGWPRFSQGTVPLAEGASLAPLGHAITDPYRSPLPAARHDGAAVVGEVLYVDRFGTLVSNIPGDQVEPGVRIKVAGTAVGTLVRTFGDVARGQLV